MKRRRKRSDEHVTWTYHLKGSESTRSKNSGRNLFAGLAQDAAQVVAEAIVG